MKGRPSTSTKRRSCTCTAARRRSGCTKTLPAQALLDRLDGEQIATALQGLPEEYRVVSTLYLVEDFSYEEIAGVLDIPVGTVRSRLHRGRRILQKLLWRVALERGVVPEAAKEPG